MTSLQLQVNGIDAITAITIACRIRVGQGINILICLLPKGMKYCLLYNGTKYSLLCRLNFKICLCLLLYKRGISVKVSNKSQTQKFTDVRNTDALQNIFQIDV